MSLHLPGGKRAGVRRRAPLIEGSFRASSAATVTPLSHTASRTIGVLEAPLSPPTRTGIGGIRGNGSRLYEVNI
jgi:hypothetical protein